MGDSGLQDSQLNDHTKGLLREPSWYPGSIEPILRSDTMSKMNELAQAIDSMVELELRHSSTVFLSQMKI